MRISSRVANVTLSAFVALAAQGCWEDEGGDAPIEDDDAGSEHADGGASSKPRADAGTQEDGAVAAQHDASSSDAGTSDAASNDSGSSNNGGPNSGSHIGDRPGAFFYRTPVPTNTAAPQVETDKQGGIHSVYPAYAGKQAFYSYCPSNCSTANDLQVVQFDTDISVDNAMLALDTNGHPRVLLSAYDRVYYASCDNNCGQEQSWTMGEILRHDSDHTVSGEALALDPSGRPRFLMHTKVALLGIGQKPPQTTYAQCNSDCIDASNWTFSVIKQEIWQGSSLRIDAQGKPHVATGLISFQNSVPSAAMGAYLNCEGDCTQDASWRGMGLGELFTNNTAAVTITPTISMEITKQGQPRIVALLKDANTNLRTAYLECDQSCRSNNWRGVTITARSDLASGLDLALDAQEKPHFAFNLNYNIGVYSCKSDVCGANDSTWDLTVVANGSDIPADEIFLFWNCTVGAWFLHDPSLAIAPNGKFRVGYQARDISGNTGPVVDITKPRCRAGLDMTWTRLSIL